VSAACRYRRFCAAKSTTPEAYPMLESYRTHMLGALSLGLFLAFPAFTQEEEREPEIPTSLMKEIEEIKKGQAEIRKELDEIKKLLQARTAPTPAPAGPNVEGVLFEIAGNPIRGESTASLVLIEFTDYQ
jgi:hypothetical protein